MSGKSVPVGVGKNIEEGVFFSKKAVASAPWLIAGKVLTFVAYLLVSVLIVRGLGPERYGVYALLLNIAEYLVVLCALGLNNGLLRFVPELVTHNNKTGLSRLLVNAASIQLLTVVTIGVALWALQGTVSHIFHLEFGNYALFVTLLMAMLLSKEYLNNVFTALFRARFLAVVSVGQASVFIAALAFLSYHHLYSPQAVLLAFSGSIALMAILSIGVLLRFFKRWKSYRSDDGIGRRRIMNLALPMMFNGMTNKLLQQYSEVFFLGYFVAPAIVGYYTLGYSLAFLALTFLPMALHTLFTSAFAEAYTRSKESLGELTKSVYQILIAFTVPLACFGFFFSPRTIVLVYGVEMAPAGPIAAFFCVFGLLPTVWMPLSMALTATEQVKKTMWLNGFQLAVNLVLDYVLIKAYGVTGAMAAIAVTYALTAPVKLWVIKGLLGGLYVPLSFLVRIAVPALTLAWVFNAAYPMPNFVELVGMGLAYACVLLVTLRAFGLVRTDDAHRFRSLDITVLNYLIDFVTGTPAPKPVIARPPYELMAQVHRLDRVMAGRANKIADINALRRLRDAVPKRQMLTTSSGSSNIHDTDLLRRCSHIAQSALVRVKIR